MPPLAAGDRGTSDRGRRPSAGAEAAEGRPAPIATMPVPAPRSLLVGVANALLHMPICGNIVAWFGFIPASVGCKGTLHNRPNCNRHLLTD